MIIINTIIIIIMGSSDNFYKLGPEHTLLNSDAGGSLDYVVLLRCVCCLLLALGRSDR